MRAARLAALCLATAALVTGCAARAPAQPSPADAPRAAPATPAIAPRPFTAAEIRSGMPAGTEIRFRVEEPGKPAVVLHWRVTAADESGMTMIERELTEDGSVVSESPPATSRWDELVMHASFPADRTVRREGSVEVPAGTFDTIDYVVTDDKEGSRTVATFRFARQLPGPPVSLAVEKDGVVIRRMVLVSRSPGG